MTISEKLSTINEIKNEIREAIISKGSSLSSDAPFSEYPGAILAISQGGENEDGWAWGWWSPEMTSVDSPAPYLVSSSTEQNDTTHACWRAFDGKIGDGLQWHATSKDSSPWISIYLGGPVKVRGFRITARFFSNSPQIMPNKGTFQGSNDGETWNDIVSFSGWARVDDGRKEEVIIAEPVNYSHYRLADLNSGYVGFAEFEFYAYTRVVTP